MSDPSCPMCGGPVDSPRPLVVCAGCHQSLASELAPQSTGEFAAPVAAALAATPGTTEAAPIAAATAATLQCSWCGRAAGEVKKLLTGGRAHICNECVALCSDILASELGDDWR